MTLTLPLKTENLFDEIERIAAKYLKKRLRAMPVFQMSELKNRNSAYCALEHILFQQCELSRLSNGNFDTIENSKHG